MHRKVAETGAKTGILRRKKQEWTGGSEKRIAETSAKTLLSLKGGEKPSLNSERRRSRREDALQGACAPPHKGRGRGPLDTSSRGSGDAGDNGRGRNAAKRSGVPGGHSFLRLKLSAKTGIFEEKRASGTEKSAEELKKLIKSYNF